MRPLHKIAMNKLDVGQTNVEPQQQPQLRLCRRYGMSKAESVESLSYMLGADVRQVILDVSKALELASNATFDKTPCSLAVDGDDDACSITSELNHLPSLQQSIRADMVKADDKYKQLPGRYLSFDLDNDETESDDTDDTLDRTYVVEMTDEVEANMLDHTAKESNAPVQPMAKQKIKRSSWRMFLGDKSTSEKTSIQVYRASSTKGSPGGETWNGRVSDWLLRAARKWWKREGVTKDLSEVKAKQSVKPKSIRAIQRSITAAASKPTSSASASKEPTTTANGLTGNNSVATDLVVCTSGLGSSTNVVPSSGVMTSASRMMRQLFAKKQTPGMV